MITQSGIDLAKIKAQLKIKKAVASFLKKYLGG